MRGWESPRNFFATFEDLLRRRYRLISSLEELELTKSSLDVPFGSGCSSVEQHALHPDEVEGLGLVLGSYFPLTSVFVVGATISPKSGYNDVQLKG